MTLKAPFSHALKTFHSARGSTVECLRQAIDVYNHNAIQESFDLSGKTLATADSEKGADTVLIIGGFKDIEDIHVFLAQISHAPRK